MRLRMTTQVPETRELRIHLPEDFPPGPARIVVDVTPEAEYLEDLEDVEDARLALEEAKREGTISLAQLKTELGL